jgi:membrane carboxypeptidase/penicillin-binding protein PbpC
MEVGVKTGTTNDGKDGWMMGFSAKYAAGVWVGYHNRQVEMSGFMETMTQPIFQGWMDDAHRDLQPKDWKRPASIQTLPAYVVRSHVGLASVEPSPANDLFPSWFKKKTANNKTQVIDIVSNKLATDCTPARARKTVTGGDANSFSSDQFVNGGAGAINTNQRDDVHRCEDTKPSVRLEINSAGNNRYQLVADVTQGTHPLSSGRFPGSLTITVNGQQVHARQVGGSGQVAYTYTAKSGGKHSVSVTIVDSVLYDSSDSGSFTAKSGGGGGGSLTITAASSDGDDTFVSWKGGSGSVTIAVGGESCTGGASGDCTLDGDFEGQIVVATDSSGKTDTETVD